MPLDYPIATRTLDNGLRVVVSPDRAVPIVTVNLWVDVGSRHEELGRTGLAHLFEHLMFQGSTNVAEGEHFELLMAQGGRLNATTWFDRTTYFETVPTGALDLALWLEADRHGRLLDALTQDNLDNQRDVVVEEKRQRYDNQPYGTALADLGAMVFPDGHPYHHPTIGSMEDLAAASLNDVHAFYRRHYGPDNTVLTVVGDVGVEEAVDRIDRYFGELAPTGQPRRPPAPDLEPLTDAARFESRGPLPNDRLYVGFRLPLAHTPEFMACTVALDALAGLTISRLHRRMVRGDEIATGVFSSGQGLVEGASLGVICIDVAEGVDVGQAEDAVCAELARFAAQGPTAVELEASLADTERSWLEALASHDERADLISHYTLLHDDPQHINTYLDGMEQLTAQRVQECAARWLNPQARATVAFLAEDDSTVGAA